VRTFRVRAHTRRLIIAMRRANPELSDELEPPAIDSARGATIHEADPALPIIDIGGVRAAPVRDVFSTDTQAFRIRLPASWAVRSTSGIAWLSGARWP
jgi:hypothetical protein